MGQNAAEEYFFDGAKPQTIRLHLMREVFTMRRNRREI
jgi:hypothetical protein